MKNLCKKKTSIVDRGIWPKIGSSKTSKEELLEIWYLNNMFLKNNETCVKNESLQKNVAFEYKNT